MADEFNIGKLTPLNIEDELKKSFISYAMAVIVTRALPDVRDGLKPVHRRILYSMNEMGITPDKPYRKSARIVGDVLGKYHPHGDSSVYDAMVRLAQDFSIRYTLVEGQGNFGSVDGDGAAAMRYTEARLSKLSMEMVRDIEKETVDFYPNFDETLMQPAVMPSRFPNLLVNGSSGIAVGMATNIPPHNLGEVIDACVHFIDNPECTVDDLMQFVKGPDFPTGGVILGKRGIYDAYHEGRGRIIVRAKSEIEEMPGNRQRIVVTEIPYMVNKAKLIEKIAEMVHEKTVEGISDIRDESDREGMRIVIELRHDVNANVVLNQLFKHTQLQDTFGIIMLALVNNEPKILNLKEMLTQYISYQEEVVTRRTKYDLNKAQERDHILQGLLTALDYIDEVVSIIRHSANVQEAKNSLIARFGLSDAQAQAIVDMRLRALTGLEREKLLEEHEQLLATIARLNSILGDRKLLLGVIREEMNIIAEKYGDERRSRIDVNAQILENEDLIPKENVIIARTALGYIKRMTVDNFHTQNRGGRGIKGMSIIDSDNITDILMTSSHAYIMFFTNLGRVYRLKTYEIPEASRTARGTAIINLLQLNPGEQVSAIIPIMDITERKNIFMVTRRGVVKKTPLSDFDNIHKNGLIAVNLKEGDELIEVKLTEPSNLIYLVTKNGMSICFRETDVRSTGRNTLGVTGMSLDPGDEIVGMQLDTQGDSLLVVSKKGMGKRSALSDFRLQKRGGKGLKCYKITEKTGDLMGVKAVNDDHEILMITTGGVVIQIRMSDIRTLGRITSGVRLIQLDEGTEVAQIAKVRGSLEEYEREALLNKENSDASDDPEAPEDEWNGSGETDDEVPEDELESGETDNTAGEDEE